MADIQSPTAEIRRAIKKRKKKKKETTRWKYIWSALLHRATITRHRASTSIHWHFAFGSILSQQRNPCTDCKSAQ